MQEKRSFTGTTVVALALLLLPGLYVGTYYATVKPIGVRSVDDGIVKLEPGYRIGGDTAKAVFTPIHWVDRQVRKDYWEVQISRGGAVYGRLPYDVLLSPQSKNVVDVSP